MADRTPGSPSPATGATAVRSVDNAALVFGSCADNAAAACREGRARNTPAASLSCCTCAANSPTGSAIESRTAVDRPSAIALFAATAVAKTYSPTSDTSGISTRKKVLARIER